MKTKFYLSFSIFLLLFSFVIQSLLIFDLLEFTLTIEKINYICFILFCPFFYIYAKNYLNNSRDIKRKFDELKDFIDSSILVTRADAKGKIIYVNKKFEEVSGWTLEEVQGKDHNIVNSGQHPKSMWSEMYNKIIVEKKIWNNIITNRKKNGELYCVDSYIKAEFDNNNNLIGFTSIRYDVTNIIKIAKELERKNVYLEHAAKILRHDMHSGINTYIPRGLSSLKRRLSPDIITQLNLDTTLKLLTDGLAHAQKVYRSVYEFTNLVKKDITLNKDNFNIKEILVEYLSTTAYKDQVLFIGDFPIVNLNDALFCTAIDNLIRNGLKYNDHDTKLIKIFMEDQYLVIQDNGRGLTFNDFLLYSEPYSRNKNQKEKGTGLGLNITIAILHEHKFDISCEKQQEGTKFKIKIL